MAELLEQTNIFKAEPQSLDETLKKFIFLCKNKLNGREFAALRTVRLEKAQNESNRGRIIGCRKTLDFIKNKLIEELKMAFCLSKEEKPNLEWIPWENSICPLGETQKLTLSYKIPTRFKEANFGNCEKISPALIEFAREWIKKPTSMFIYGNLGRGKSHFAFAIIREMVEWGAVDYPEICYGPELDSLLLEAIKSDSGDYGTIKKYCNADGLLIDDFGRETDSDRMRRQYFDIINSRYQWMRPTIITSNFTLDEIAKKFDPAIASRMQEWAMIEIKGPDLRK